MARVAHLEQKHGGYKMVSNGIFTYEELRAMPMFTILVFRDAMYRGQVMEEEKREGAGVMVYDSGRLYEGHWMNDKREGMGFERYTNGHTYQG